MVAEVARLGVRRRRARHDAEVEPTEPRLEDKKVEEVQDERRQRHDPASYQAEVHQDESADEVLSGGEQARRIERSRRPEVPRSRAHHLRLGELALDAQAVDGHIGGIIAAHGPDRRQERRGGREHRNLRVYEVIIELNRVPHIKRRAVALDRQVGKARVETCREQEHVALQKLPRAELHALAREASDVSRFERDERGLPALVAVQRAEMVAVEVKMPIAYAD
mmetsp:Transcript_17065/g.43723  ORF Transcript_17065/g.43723 Transcript_17065/m.43723 type:complete len:223 (-) Transcript_17065:1139-1807(-)